MRTRNLCLCCVIASLLFMAAFYSAAQSQQPAQRNWPEPKEGDYIVREYKFGSGELWPELRLHYTSLGAPQKDATGHVTNAVLILHGTGGSGRGLVQQQFAGELFGPGQPLDATKYYIILPDNIGHGRSSKPSDGLRAKFPSYDYDDMVRAQHLLLTEGLGVNHLRLVMGTSMGCMHSFVWGTTHPEFMDALLPLACLPVEIAGRNRVWRKMLMDAITSDPEWNNGDYTVQPRGLRTAIYLLLIAGSAPLQWQKNQPSRDAADKFLADSLAARMRSTDANDLLFAVNASRNYNPSPKLDRIIAPLVHINSADDFINPPELGIAEREMQKVKRGRFILIPTSDETRGHGSHTRAILWKKYLEELLRESERTQ